jgi:hypothetical protein
VLYFRTPGGANLPFLTLSHAHISLKNNAAPRLCAHPAKGARDEC